MTTARTLLSPTLIQTTSKLQEALLHGKPRTITSLGRGGERVTLVTAAGITNNGAQTTRFAVPTSTIVRPKPQNATLIQNPISIATSSASSSSGFTLTESPKIEPTEKPKTLTISISEVFASAQPLPLQEEARQHNKGKMTTMADLEPQAASMGPLNAVLQQKGITIATQSVAQQPEMGNSLYRQVVRQSTLPSLQQKPSILTTVALQQPQTVTTKPITTTQTKTGTGISNSEIATETTSPKATGATKNIPSIKKAFACDHAGCNKSFDKASLLKKHAKLHSKQYKFTCDVCHKGFESHSKKEDHYRKHTGVKPFLCEICGSSFRYKGDRTKHLRNIHRVSKSSNEESSLTGNNVSGLTKTRLQQSVSNFTPASEDTTSSTTSSDFQSLSGSIASTDNIFQVGNLSGGGPGSTSTATEASSAMSEDGTNASLVSSFSTSTPSIESPSKTETPSNASAGLASLLDFDHPDPELDDASTVTMSLDDVLQFAQPIVSDLLY